MPASLPQFSSKRTDLDPDRSNLSSRPREEANFDGTIKVKERQFHLVRQLEDQHDTKNKSQLSSEDLYPDWEVLDPLYISSFRLMRESRQYIDQSLDFYANNNLISADDEIQKLQALLPELFCCRAMGDGFGYIVNAVMNALRNTNGIPLKENQVIALKRVFHTLHIEPFISFDKAVDTTEILENEDMVIEPQGLNQIADLLIDLSDE